MVNCDRPQQNIQKNDTHCRFPLFSLFIRILDDASTNQNLSVFAPFYTGNIPLAAGMGTRVYTKEKTVFAHDSDEILSLIKNEAGICTRFQFGENHILCARIDICILFFHEHSFPAGFASTIKTHHPRLPCVKGAFDAHPS
jgi:hypothetical protein